MLILYSNQCPVSFPVEGAGEGREIAGPLEQDEVEGILNKFFRKGEIRLLASENGLEGTLFNKVFSSFRNYCLNLDALPPELYIRIKDISQDAGHPDDLFPYFLDHAKNIFPHLSSMEELKKISDLSTPANWYPEARSLERKIIYHAGPTNSGKTYQAIKRLFEAESGIYCAPLKLLANEICQKSNAAGTPCDLVTGEERRFASLEGPSSHIACTIEMASITNKYKVAVIDEVQMIRDSQRGWAWTRALLGLNAEEIHVCGENSAIDLVKRLMLDTFDEFEVRKYERLSPLHWSDTALESLQNIQAGDCIVCFNKKDIYSLREKLESMGIKCAILYGSLPPGAKLSEAARFNDPDNICKVLLATDSIGMGVNLSVRRIIFNTLEKRVKNSQGEFETEKLSTSQILQIGGRAGRYGMDFDRGEVTTMNQVDIKLLHCLKNRDVELITQAGLHPTSDQIETFAFHLPGSSLADLITIFEGICKLDGEKFFMCTTDTFKTFAKMLEHIPLPLRTKYLLCNSPINTNPFLTSMLLKIARRISNGEAVHATWFRIQIGWPLAPPQTTKSLEHLESVYDAMDLYLWLSYRFVDMFPDVHIIRDMRVEVDLLIQHGVKNITKMSKEKSISLENVTTEKLDEESIDSDETYGKYNANDKRSNQHYISSYDNLFNKSMNEKNGRLAKVERTTGFEIPEELIEKYEREDNILSTSLLGKRRKILKTREKREDYTLNTPLVNKMRKSSKTKSVPKNPNIHKARRTPIEARNYTNLVDNQSREDKKEKYLSEIPLKVRLNNFFKQLPAITEKMISTFPEKSVRCRSEMQNEKSEKKDSGSIKT
ncbi:hypothetical protein KUTeg_005248 [Tegillarca granosa]|uniref:RNA helicase n=1 Tax=Tegillarca granosa TaxID=220873 RepID=A0ABQ9FJ89_TEGGR|nr:hypothetical protein KUTeg_005248 [Tegillarca granosa]